MLVTLGNNQAIGAGSSITLPYACKSLSKVFVKIDDSTGSTAWDHTVTITLGQRVIVQSSGVGLFGFSNLNSGASTITTEILYAIDLGNHELLNNENVYVKIQSGTNALDAVDVSALVDQPLPSYPVRYTEYSSTTFTNAGTLQAICYDSGRLAIDEDSAHVEIRDAVNSSSPTVISAVNWFGSQNKASSYSNKYGMLVKNDAPLTTSFNYTPNDADRILCASLVQSSKDQVQQAKSEAALVRNRARTSI